MGEKAKVVGAVSADELLAFVEQTDRRQRILAGIGLVTLGLIGVACRGNTSAITRQGMRMLGVDVVADAPVPVVVAEIGEIVGREWG